MSYDESIDHLSEQPKLNPAPKIVRNTSKFHVCIPLYHAIPKELQTGWTRMGEHGVQEWDNTTDIQFFLDKFPEFDKNLYCGTCGRLMVKGRNQTINPIEEAKVIKLL